MSRAAGLFEGGNFVIQRLPASAEHMGARDYNVNLVGARFHRAANFCNPLRQRR